MSGNRTIRGKEYSLVVLRILEWDENGRPSKCIIGHDDTVFRLSDQSEENHFLTAYVPTDMIRKATKH